MESWEAHRKVWRAWDAEFWSSMRRAMWWWAGAGMEEEKSFTTRHLRENRGSFVVGLDLVIIIMGI